MIGPRHLLAALAFATLPSSRSGTGRRHRRLQRAARRLTQAWADGFTAETGITVTIRKGSDILLANQIVQEGVNSPADVFLTENSPAMVMVEQAGLFAPVDARDARRDPREFPARERHVDRHRRTHDALRLQQGHADEADLPKSMLDLADPEWQGRWGASPAGADFQAIVSALLQLAGRSDGELARGLKHNALAYRGNFEAMRGANVGEIAGALIYHYYYFGDQRRHRRELGQARPALFPQRGSRRLRLDLGRRRAEIARQSRRGASLPRLRHRTQGPGHPARRQRYEYAIGSGAEPTRACRRSRRSAIRRSIPRCSTRRRSCT